MIILSQSTFNCGQLKVHSEYVSHSHIIYQQWASQVAQLVKKPPTMQENLV